MNDCTYCPITTAGSVRGKSSQPSASGWARMPMCSAATSTTVYDLTEKWVNFL